MHQALPPPTLDQPVPEVVVQRLPLYVRVLGALIREEIEVVSSQQLGDRLQMTPAQIRKDLSYFGRFGKQGRGYSVVNLLNQLKEILGLSRQWNVGLVGVGRLGLAILSYPGFAPEGFRVVAAFDADPAQVGQRIGGVGVYAMEDLDRLVGEMDISIGVVAVPGAHAQRVVDRLVECGVRAILNYAPTSPQTQEGVRIRNIDPVLSLQSMTYYLMGSERGEDVRPQE
jgi:redox-sensing transcriptional repressor